MSTAITPFLIDQEIAEIDKELARVEPLRKRRAALVDLRSTYAVEESTHPELIPAPSSPREKRFASLGVSDAITAFLKENKGAFFSPTEIAKAIKDGGHVPTSPNFMTIVYTICKRRGGKEYEVSERDGKKAFRIQ